MLIALIVAANALPIEVVGFSPDDRYVAWIEHGVGEGSGYPWARLHVTEVSRSADAVPPVEIKLDSGNAADSEDVAVGKARAAADSARGKLRVGSWIPAKVIRHDEKGDLRDPRGAPIGTLQVEERAVRAKLKCDAPFRPVLLRLSVFFLDGDKPARLAEDTKLPTDRACASSCEVAGVFAHGKAALAVVRCGVQGFEGPSSKYSAYAGTLPSEL
jgi:Predicted secreted protein (DUF2259)